MKPLIITIDGPAGAGKTTVSRMLARRLGFQYIDTGALYRGVAHAVKAAGIDSDDDEKLRDLCRSLKLQLMTTEDGLRVLSNGADITGNIRTPEITMLASAISARPVIRAYLLELQRDLGREKNIVIEGRDMGTVVFPDADIKFFLNAATDIRARRRYEELKNTSDVSYETVKADLVKRDENDSTRELAPLKPAADAVRVDSTGLSVDGVVDEMMAVIRKKQNPHPQP